LVSPAHRPLQSVPLPALAVPGLVAHLPRHSGRHLYCHLFAGLCGDLVALALLGNLLALCLGHVVADLVWHLGALLAVDCVTDGLADGLAGLPRHLLAILFWHLLAVLLGDLVTDLPGHGHTDGFGHLLAGLLGDFIGHILARLNRHLVAVLPLLPICGSSIVTGQTLLLVVGHTLVLVLNLDIGLADVLIDLAALLLLYSLANFLIVTVANILIGRLACCLVFCSADIFCLVNALFRRLLAAVFLVRGVALLCGGGAADVLGDRGALSGVAHRALLLVVCGVVGLVDCLALWLVVGETLVRWGAIVIRGLIARGQFWLLVLAILLVPRKDAEDVESPPVLITRRRVAGSTGFRVLLCRRTVAVAGCSVIVFRLLVLVFVVLVLVVEGSPAGTGRHSIARAGCVIGWGRGVVGRGRGIVCRGWSVIHRGRGRI